jgi:hypothetical protein
LQYITEWNDTTHAIIITRRLQKWSFIVDDSKKGVMLPAMEKKHTKRTRKMTPKRESSESIAKKIGMSASAVYELRRTGGLPKNPLIRAAYLRLTANKGKSKPVPK